LYRSESLFIQLLYPVRSILN